jgi:hypothetical protein
MGFFKWLFGKREEQADEGLPGIFITGPAERPELPSELEPLLTNSTTFTGGTIHSMVLHARKREPSGGRSTKLMTTEAW